MNWLLWVLVIASIAFSVYRLYKMTLTEEEIICELTHNQPCPRKECKR